MGIPVDLKSTMVKLTCGVCGRALFWRAYHNDPLNEDIFLAANGDFVRRHCQKCRRTTEAAILFPGNGHGNGTGRTEAAS